MKKLKDKEKTSYGKIWQSCSLSDAYTARLVFPHKLRVGGGMGIESVVREENVVNSWALRSNLFERDFKIMNCSSLIYK